MKLSMMEDLVIATITAICLSAMKELYVESLYMSHKDLYSIVHFLFLFLVIMFWLDNGSD
jgi:hypothetical protein